MKIRFRRRGCVPSGALIHEAFQALACSMSNSPVIFRMQLSALVLLPTYVVPQAPRFVCSTKPNKLVILAGSCAPGWTRSHGVHTSQTLKFFSIRGPALHSAKQQCSRLGPWPAAVCTQPDRRRGLASDCWMFAVCASGTHSASTGCQA